jgi:16S rRNA processing protein RimM
MANREETFYLGYIKKGHSTLGEVEIFLDVDDPTKYKKKELMLVELNDNMVPFFIEKIQLKHNGAIVKFKNVNSGDQASLLVGASIYLPLKDLPPLKGKKSFYYHEIIGFKVIDALHGDIGTITEVLEHLKQPVMTIQHGEKEIMIPLIDEFIQEVNREQKTIHVISPEGLIELYLE